MAEIAAGALVAEQVVSTGVQVAAAASVAKPTQPLRATLHQIATSQAEDPSLALARSHHTVTIIDNKAYIFGGLHSDGKLCNTDIHAVSMPSSSSDPRPPTADYACYPAFPLQDATTGDLLVPAPRQGHAACARGKHLLIHGGSDASGHPIDEDACLWLWDTETLRWRKISPPGPGPAPRAGHTIAMLASPQEALVVHGGDSTASSWRFDFDAVAWTELPACPVLTVSAAVVQDTLYAISGASVLGGAVHFLRLGAEEAKWETHEYPANELVAGPRPRVGGVLVPVSTGFGRYYLLYLLGRETPKDKASGEGEQTLCSDIWALQLPSRGVTPANVKDAIRDKLPGHIESGAFSWAEVNILPTEEFEYEGKAHPGPRAFFGASPSVDGKGVVFWGGQNAKGEREADGWTLRVQ